MSVYYLDSEEYTYSCSFVWQFSGEKSITKHVGTFYAYKSTTPFMCMTEAQLLRISGRWCNCRRTFFSWNDAFAVSSRISTRKNLRFSRIHPLRNNKACFLLFETFSEQVFQLDSTQLNATRKFHMFAVFFNKFCPSWSCITFHVNVSEILNGLTVGSITTSTEYISDIWNTQRPQRLHVYSSLWLKLNVLTSLFLGADRKTWLVFE